MTLAVQPFRWSGEAMIPLRPRLADRDYVIGEIYPLAPLEARSSASHAHYFAMVNEAWNNLPEDVADRWPTSEHLRKFALIKAGYRDERSLVCSSKAEALRIAAFLRPADEFAIITVTGNVVTEYRAKSQSLPAMGREVFQASKDAVLGVLAGLIEVQPLQLQQRALESA